MDDQPNNSASDVLDRELLAQLVADLGDAAIVRNLIATYLDELDHRHVAVVDAVATRDTNKVSYAAHALVSPSRTLGVVGIAGPSRAIEVMAKNGRLDGVQAELKRLADVIPRAVTALKAW